MMKSIVAGAMAMAALTAAASQPLRPNPAALAARIAAVEGQTHPMLKAAIKTETRLDVVDVLIAFDRSAVNWLTRMGRGTPEKYAADCVEKLNYCLSMSHLEGFFQFRLAGTVVMSLDASRMPLINMVLNMINENGEVVASGEWKKVTDKRAEVGADIVSVLSACGSLGNVGQGFALESEWGGRSAAAIKAFGDWAYNACAIEAVDDDYTMVHEIGHNMGCGHPDDAMAPGLAAMSTPGNPMTGPQFYDYSSGWYLWDRGMGYYTIMSYNWGGIGPNGGYNDSLRFEPLPFFSTPEYSWNGHVLGDVKHDNRRTLINNYRYVAQYRVSQQTPIKPEPVVDPIVEPVVEPVVDPDPMLPDVPESLEGLTPVKPSEVVSGVALKKATEVGGCWLDAEGMPIAAVTFKVGKAGKKGTKVSGSVTPFATGKKASMKSQTVDLSAGPRTLSFEARGLGTLSVKLGLNAAGKVVYSGVLDGKTVTSAAVGGESTGARAFSKPAVPAEVKGVAVNADYLPDGEPVSMQGKKWVLAKAASIAYKKDRTTGMKRWFVNNDKPNPNKTNLSALKLSYKAKDGSFKGSFTLYGLQKDRLKKVKVDVRGVAVGGKGYGIAAVKKVDGAVWRVTIK